MNITQIIEPRIRDIGDFSVRRALPSAGCRTIGPYVFFDHMGPVDFAPGKGIDVRPHPHICLATLTYLFEGEILHRDSLGTTQSIRPGEVNWMTAGRGIVHSERTSDALRKGGQRLHGLQVWIALPQLHEEMEPSFLHYKSEDTPVIEKDRVTIRVVAGTAYGVRSKVTTVSDLFYVDLNMMARSLIVFEPLGAEQAIYVADGNVRVDGQLITQGTMAVLKAGASVELETDGGARVVAFGGEPLEGERHLWWNFVASSRARIDRAKDDWANNRFPGVEGEEDVIPLPDK